VSVNVDGRCGLCDHGVHLLVMLEAPIRVKG
jgi:hypothetical protein